MRCPTCRRQPRSFKFHGFCARCYESGIKVRGELALLIESYKYRFPLQEYILETYNKVYCHFQRMDREDGEWVTARLDRKWGLELIYNDGFPCPPIVKFVSPYKHSDDSPMMWPKLTVTCDSLRQLIDIPYIHPRSSLLITPDGEMTEKLIRAWQPHNVVQRLATRIVPNFY